MCNLVFFLHQNGISRLKDTTLYQIANIFVFFYYSKSLWTLINVNQESNSNTPECPHSRLRHSLLVYLNNVKKPIVISSKRVSIKVIFMRRVKQRKKNIKTYRSATWVYSSGPLPRHSQRRSC